MEQLMMEMMEFLQKCDHIPTPYDCFLALAPTQEIQSAFIRHYRKIHGWGGHTDYKNITVSVSGGADSDRMIDLIERMGYKDGTVTYVFFDTGMEYKATKDHLTDLERKYGIEIRRVKAKIPVALACKRYGVPFLSKQVSEFISRLQHHGFKWEDRPFEELYAEYPKCKSALRWWCNKWDEKSRTNISWNKHLKEFMILNPPTFLISPICCIKAKKDVAKRWIKESDSDLNVQGVRKAEGGARASISTCFEQKDGFSADILRPIFWFKKEDCEQYDIAFNVCHSLCYTKYGLRRTGCACCPFGIDFEKELEAAKKYEPQLYILAIAVFGESYEYTRKYKEFVKQRQLKGGADG